MKVAKYLLLLVLLVLIGGGLYILISDKKYEVEEEITVKSPRELAFDQVKNLKNWKNWISVNQKDLNLSFSEKDDAAQSYLTWNSSAEKEEGKLIHQAITHYSSIQQEAESHSSLGARSHYEIAWSFHKHGEDSTQIDLNIHAKPNYFTKVKMALGLNTDEEFIQTQANTSLQNIKELLHKKMTAYHLTIEGTIHKKTIQYYVYRTEASRNKPKIIQEKRAEILTSLQKQLDSLTISTTGPALMVYNSVDKRNHNLIFSAGYPVSSEIDTTAFKDQEFVIGTLEGEEYLKGTLQGNYSNIPKLWEKARSYMVQNDLTEDTENKPYEIFKVSPTDSHNPAKWVTELYIPIVTKEIKTVEEINRELN